MVDGYTFAQAVVENLRHAAKLPGGLTQANLMNAAWNTTVKRPLMLKARGAVNGHDDAYLVEYGEIHVYDADKRGWKRAGEFDLSGELGLYEGGN